MSSAETTRWLAELQARFSSVLRAPLVVRRGQLGSDLASYPEQACADILPTSQLTAAERLGTYQRQYWMRLLNFLQEQYPLTTRLLGAWFFNQYATRFLLAQPPHGHDLGQVADGLSLFLAEDLRDDPLKHTPAGPTLPRSALLEAAQIDAAFRRVFIAPEQPSWQLTAADGADLARRRLRLSAAMTCVQEHWPLLTLRARVMHEQAEQAVALPAPLARPKRWLLYRNERGVAQCSLGPLQARLFELLPERTIGEALALVEAEWPERDRERLPELVDDFFAFAARAGLFVGFCDE